MEYTRQMAQLNDEVFFSLQILPEIHHKIKWFNVESSSIECILLSRKYPNLSRLGLHDLVLETAMNLFTDNILFLILSIINY